MNLASHARAPAVDDPVYRTTDTVVDLPGVRSGPIVAAGVVIWALMSLAAAFHWFGTSVDYFNYITFYEGLRFELFAGDSRFEGGFVLLSWFYKYVIGADYSILALSVVAASLAIKFYVFFRYLRSPLLAIFVYIMIFYPLYEYTQIRAALASSLVYWSLHRFLERKYYSASIMLAGAIVFHVSAVIVAFAVAIFICIKRPAGVAIAFVGILALAIWYEEITSTVTATLPLINPLATKYLDNASSAVLPNLWSVQNIFLIFAMSAVIISNKKDETGYESVFLCLSILGLFMLVVFMNSPVLAQRGKELLTVAAIFLVFRGQVDTARQASFAFMLLGGFWSVYRAVEQGVLGG